MIGKYFDALTSSSFKIAQDGRHLFCPWGTLGTCYIIPSEEDYERLRRQIRTYMIVSLVVVLVTGTVFRSYVPSIVAVSLLVVFYLVWVRSPLRGLQASTERLSFQESATSQARTHSAAMLWLITLFSIAFVAVGVFLLIAEPKDWLVAFAAIGFFGVCAAFGVYMIVIRYSSVAR